MGNCEKVDRVSGWMGWCMKNSRGGGGGQNAYVQREFQYAGREKKNIIERKCGRAWHYYWAVGRADLHWVLLPNVRATGRSHQTSEQSQLENPRLFTLRGAILKKMGFFFLPPPRCRSISYVLSNSIFIHHLLWSVRPLVFDEPTLILLFRLSLQFQGCLRRAKLRALIYSQILVQVSYVPSFCATAG